MTKNEMMVLRKRLIKSIGRRCHDCKSSRMFGYGVTGEGVYTLVVTCKCGTKVYEK